jgi:hypothetical protein
MPRVGFEPTIPVFERARIFSAYRAATMIGTDIFTLQIYWKMNIVSEWEISIAWKPKCFLRLSIYSYLDTLLSSLCSHSVDTAVQWNCGAGYGMHTVMYLCDRPQWGWLVCNWAARYDKWMWVPDQDTRRPRPQFTWYLYSLANAAQSENAQIEEFSFRRVKDKNWCYVPERIFHEYDLCVTY